MTANGQPADRQRVAAIVDALRLFIEPDQVTELRGLNVGMARNTRSGFYDGQHLEQMAQAALDMDGRASGVYFTLNPVNPALLARRPNRAELARDTVCDADITDRRWLLIDADPERGPDCSATHEEKRLAWEVIQNVKTFLIEEMDAPADALILADSGNGYHLLVRVDYPVHDAAEVFKAALHYLGDRFDAPGVKIDRKVYNAARITKVYGTLAAKGVSTSDRPWRRSGILEALAPSEPDGRRGVLPAASIASMVLAGREVLARQTRPAPAAAPSIIPFSSKPAADDRQRLLRRAWADRRTWDVAISGQNGHGTTLRQASRLVNGYCLSDDEALEILRDWNRECQPPWEDRDLVRKVREARKKGPGNGKPMGWLLLQEGEPLPPEPAAQPAAQPGEVLALGSEEPAATVKCSRGIRPAAAGGAASDDAAAAAGAANAETVVVPVEPPKDRPNAPHFPDSPIYRGLAGDIVKRIDPQTEADPVAVLAHVLVFFGNIIGGPGPNRGPYVYAQGTHYGNLFALLVGESGVGRKGVSYRMAIEIFRQLETFGSTWHLSRGEPDDERQGCILSGAQSGEAVIERVRDDVHRVPSRGADRGNVQTSRGYTDKRLLLKEDEFSRFLKAGNRDGSTLTETARTAYDTGDLACNSKKSALRTTGANISILGHITKAELEVTIDPTALHNGVFNRFIPLYCAKSKDLPHGGEPVDFGDLVGTLWDRITNARGIGRVERNPEAKATWEAVYPELNSSNGTLVGELRSRAIAHVTRLSLIYALLDGKGEIELSHHESALALWRYCEATLEWLFPGNTMGDPIADDLRKYILEANGEIVTKTQISKHFSNHGDAIKINRAIDILERRGIIRRVLIYTGKRGRPCEQFVATEKALKLYRPYQPDEGKEKSAS